MPFGNETKSCSQIAVNAWWQFRAERTLKVSGKEHGPGRGVREPE